MAAFNNRFFISGVSVLALLLGTACPVDAKRVRPQRQVRPLVVRDIYVELKDVFDPSVPGENIWPFRLANQLHVRTRASVIRRELLARPGTPSDTEQIDESERNLRALPFIRDASILKKTNPDGSVDLLVMTQDSWTLQPQLGVSSEGGESTFSAGIEEINLLGYGKYLSYFYKEDVDGRSHLLGYNDPQFLNTRFRLTSTFQDIPTGSIQDVNLERPFFAQTTRVAGGASFNHFQKMEKVFEAGNEISRHDREHVATRPFIGLWLNNDPMNAVRSTLAYRYSEETYHAQAGTLASTLPEHTTLSGPILGFSYTQADFIKETFIEKTGRVEDYNLGHDAQLAAGYVSKKFGATETSIPIALSDTFGFGNRREWFGLFTLGASNRYKLYEPDQVGGRLYNALYFGSFNYFRHLRDDFPDTGVVHIESAYLQRPDVSNLLSVGGNTGLRGFKNDFMTGNKTVLINLENRFFYPREVFHLAYVGGAFFLDAGQAQPQGQEFTRKDFHCNVGAGMRFGLSRSSEGTVFRVDLAYALGPIQQANRWILSISSSQGFKRSANTYAKYNAINSAQ